MLKLKLKPVTFNHARRCQSIANDTLSAIHAQSENEGHRVKVADLVKSTARKTSVLAGHTDSQPDENSGFESLLLTTHWAEVLPPNFLESGRFHRVVDE